MAGDAFRRRFHGFVSLNEVVCTPLHCVAVLGQLSLISLGDARYCLDDAKCTTIADMRWQVRERVCIRSESSSGAWFVSEIDSRQSVRFEPMGLAGGTRHSASE